MAAKVLAKGKMGNHRYVSNGETLVSATAKTTALAIITILRTKRVQAKARMANTANQGPTRQTVCQVRARTRVEKEADPLHPNQRLSRGNPNYARISSWGNANMVTNANFTIMVRVSSIQRANALRAPIVSLDMVTQTCQLPLQPQTLPHQK